VCKKHGKLYHAIKTFGSGQDLYNWVKLVKINENLNFSTIVKNKLQTKVATIPNVPDFIFPNVEPAYKNKQALKYLESRHITKQDIVNWRMTVSIDRNYRNRIIFPSLNQFGQINYFVARDYTGRQLDYLIPSGSKLSIIFNELFIDWQQPIVLTEGVFDAVKVFPNSIPLLGKILSSHSLLFEKLTHHQTDVFVILDRDAKKDAFFIAEMLSMYGNKVFVYSIKDKEDLGVMTHQEAQKCLSESKLFTHKMKIQDLLEN